MNIKQIRELAQIAAENGLSAIEIAEGYLFPRVWNRRILKHKVEKRLPTIAVYALALCGR